MAPLRIPRNVLLGNRKPLTEDERRLVLRVVAVTSVPLALVVVFVLLVAGTYGYVLLQNRSEENRELIREARAFSSRLNMERRARETAIAWRVYDECVENEAQDATDVALLGYFIQLARRAPASPQRTEAIERFQELQRAREPVFERDCPIPGAPRP